MPPEPMVQPRRLGWRLPLAISLLLVVVVGVFTWAAYREVRSAELRSAEERVADVAGQLAELLSRNVVELRTAAATAVADPELAAALRDASPPAVEEARDVLDAQLAGPGEILAAELRDAEGVLIAEARSGGAGEAAEDPPGFPAWAEEDSLVVGGFEPVGGGVRYAVAARIADDGVPLGYVVHRRALTGSPEDVRRLEELLGPGMSFAVGVPGGTWTNLAEVVEVPEGWPGDDPALDPSDAGAEPETSGVSGASAPIAGAPWVAWVDVPLDVVLEGPRAFLGRMVPLGALVVGLGALGGGVLSRRLTATLEASEEQFRTLAAAAPDAIVTADGEGRITFLNHGAEEMFGRPAADAVGRPLTVLMPERYHEAHRRGLRRWASRGTGPVMDSVLELEGVRADGSEFPIELSVTGREHGGSPVFTGIIRDVTERKRRDEEIRSYAAQLEATNEELEAFSYSVSHDLRAPLRAIHGFSQAVREDYRDRLDDQGADYLDRVCAASERMGMLIDDLLELSRATRTEMHLERVDLSDLARRTGEELADGSGGRDVDLRIDPDLTARGDRKLLELVLGNLMGNAWKFTAREERPVIEVGVDGEDGAFFVRDNGAGFDMTYADKLFDPFQRLHSVEEFEGTGIGLALVQRIVHRHGGEVWGEGAEGDGASFHFTLPEP